MKGVAWLLPWMLLPVAAVEPAPAGPGSTPVPQPQIRFDVPMDLVETGEGPVAMVEVRVNGQGPFHLAVDTGGQGQLRLDRAVAERLGLPQVGEAQGSDGSGKRVAMPIVQVDRLEIGGAVFTAVAAPTRDYPPAASGRPREGLLCFGLFSPGLLTLDYPAKRLRYEPGELPPADGAKVLALRDTRAVPQIEIDVAGKTVAADLDTGSMGGILLPGSLADSVPLTGPAVKTGSATTVSQHMELREGRLAGDVHFGREVLKQPAVGFLDGLKAANIGARVLRDFAITFDGTHHRVRLVRGGAKGSGALVCCRLPPA